MLKAQLTEAHNTIANLSQGAQAASSYRRGPILEVMPPTEASQYPTPPPNRQMPMANSPGLGDSINERIHSPFMGNNQIPNNQP